MESTAIAVRLASGAVAPLIKKLFVTEPPGAALAAGPTRISALVSFKGEKHTLTSADLARLASRLVHRANRAPGPHEAAVPEADEQAVALAVAATLGALGEITMTDLQAVGLGHREFARELSSHAPPSAHHLGDDATGLYTRVLDTAALHILDFFTKRSTFTARTAVEQTRRLERLIRATDLIVERIPSQTARDARFEQKYAEHIARRHGELTIYGLDMHHAREWPLDTAYISLEAAHGNGGPVPAEHALAGRERVLLRGPAGCGKTTLVQWLAVTTARRSGADGEPLPAHLSQLVGRVPFVLPLRRIVRDGLPPAPDGFLHAARSTAAGAQPDGWADRVLRAGRALLLVDGIDEIPEREREDVRRWMRELLGDFPGNLWLVTSRPSAVREDWLQHEGFTELALSPMSRTDVSAFVHRWHAAAGADGAERLLERIRTGGDLTRLATSPLMCGLLCALHRERHGALPRGRKELYEAALTLLLERRDAERGVSQDGLRLDKEDQVRLLQKLAYWLLRNDRAEMDRSDAVARIAAALPYLPHLPDEPEPVFRYLLDRSGLLREPAPGSVDFVHRTFQDYLAAQALVEEGDFPLLLDNAGDDQWEDVVRMSVAHARPAERGRILSGLVDDERRRAGGRTPFLAMACLDEATELDPEVHSRVLRRTAGFLPPSDPRAARTLAAVAGSLTVGLLPGPEGLTDEQAVCTTIAVSHLGTDAAQAFLARFRAHPSLAVRRQLTWCWGRFELNGYADEVLRHLDPTDLYYTAPTPRHLDALARLGGRPRIQIPGPFEPRDLAGLLDPATVTHLWLNSGWPTHSRLILTDFPNLRRLVLPTAPPPSAHIPEDVEVVLGEPPEE